MKFVREKYIVICLAAFALTSGFGLILALFPDLVAAMLGAPQPNTFFARVLGLVLIPMGLCYLMVLIFDEAKTALLAIASIEKGLAVLYVIVALARCQVSWTAGGMVALDGALAVFGVMAIMLPDEGRPS
jgi:hypothetical protein